MAGGGSKVGMKLLTTLIGIPVGLVTKRLVDNTWKAARPEDPPKMNHQPAAKVVDVVSWAALTAAGVAATEIITRKSSEEAYRRLFGTEPPPPPLPKSEKKAQKQAEKAEKKMVKALEDATKA
jgi:hypothetical protein